MSDKDVILPELQKTITRLQNRGVNVTGTFFGVKEDDTEEKWIPEDNFVKVFPQELLNISKRLSGLEMGVLLYLVPFISYQTGMLTMGRTSGIRPINQTDITGLTQLSNKTVSDIMEGLVKKRILSRNKVGRSYQYFANPYVFFKGQYINKTLKAMFETYR